MRSQTSEDSWKLRGSKEHSLQRILKPHRASEKIRRCGQNLCKAVHSVFSCFSLMQLLAFAFCCIILPAYVRQVRTRLSQIPGLPRYAAETHGACCTPEIAPSPLRSCNPPVDYVPRLD